MNVKAMIKAYLGILAVLGILMLTVPLVDIIYGEKISLSYLLLGELLLVMGLVAGGLKAQPLTTLEALIVGISGWVSIPLISAVAFSYEAHISLLDATFECISGFTGTGFTVVNVAHLKHSLILWRSLMQWTGELGFVVFAMVFVPYFYDIARSLYGIERPVKIEASFYRTASKLLLIYLILTVVGILTYYMSGMTLFESINFVMTTVATGGMSPYNQGYSVVYSRAPLTMFPIIALMIIGGMNFYDIYNLMSGRFRSLIRSEELKYYVAVLIVIPLMTALAYRFVEGFNLKYSLIAGIFNSISGITTTGFNIGDLSKLKDLTKAIFVLGMFIGGMTFSTAGGIKALRLMLLFKKLKNMTFTMIMPPHTVKRITIKETTLAEADISNALLLIVIHGAAVFVGATLITYCGYHFIDALFEATSAASCVGLSVNVVSSTAPALVKIVIMFLMISGRIEYIPLFLLASLIVNRRTMRLLKW